MARRNGTSALVNMAPANTQYMQKLMPLIIIKTLLVDMQLANQLKSLSTYTYIAMRIYVSSGCQLCAIYTIKAIVCQSAEH